MADKKEKGLDVYSPDENSPKEEKEMFVKVIDQYINQNDGELSNQAQ